MFVKNKLSGPPGCNPLDDGDRMPVLRVVAGDSWTVDAELVAADCGPASPSNSYVEFVLSENQFSPPMWTGGWNSGVYPDGNRPGLVHVRIPRELTQRMRRGSYMFSMRVADRMRYFFDTQLKGYFLVEYMPTSEQHSIPYRDGTSDIFGSTDQGKNEGGDCRIEALRVRNDADGLWYKVVAVKDEDTGEITLGVGQSGTPR